MLHESVKEGMYEQEPKASIQVNVCVRTQEWAWGDVLRSRRLHMLGVDPEIGRNPGCLEPHLRGWTWCDRAGADQESLPKPVTDWVLP